MPALSPRFCAAVSLALLCSACAHTTKPSAEAGQRGSAVPVVHAQALPQNASGQMQADDLPNVDLSAPIFYLVLEAEIALQRSEPAQAYRDYLLLAQQTRDPRFAQRATSIAYEAHAWTQAADAARLWRELAPRNQGVAQALLSLQLTAGQLSEAEGALATRIEQGTAAEREAWFRQLPQLLRNAPNKNEALLMAERLLSRYAREPLAQLALGQIAQNAGNDFRALRAYDAALELQPDLEIAALFKAQLQLQQNQGAEALALLKSFVAANPNALQARAALARTLLANKEMAAAQLEFETLLKKDPDNLQAQFALGALAIERKDYAQAEAYFRRYLAAAEDAGDNRITNQARVYLAQALQAQDKSKEALAVLEEVDDAHPYTPAIIQRAVLLAQEKRLDEARALLDDARQNTTEVVERTRLTLAEVQLLNDARQYPQAFDLIDRTLKQQPDDPELLYEHGMLAEKIDRVDLMEQSMRAVIKLRPDSALAYNALGYTLVDRKLRLKEARALIEKAYALEPDSPAIIDSVGWMHYRLGDLAKAEEFLQRAQQLLPDAEVFTHLGEVLWMQGKRDEAKKFWRAAREKAPDNEVLRSTLKRLKISL